MVEEPVGDIAYGAVPDARVDRVGRRVGQIGVEETEGKALIQQALGHSSLGTTSRYLAHINPQEVVDAMRAREWTP